MEHSKAQPDLEQWRRLYVASASYCKLAPWGWMDDLDLFAVEDPRTGEAGYCTVLGGAGLEFGVSVFLGESGLAHYLDLIDDAFDPEHFGASSSLRVLSFTLDDRTSVSPGELAVIRALGLRYRGRKAWPKFISYSPGYLATELSASEAKFLTDALMESMNIALAVRDGGLDLKGAVEQGQVWARVRKGDVWQLERRTLSIPPAAPLQPPPPDADRLARLRAAAKRSQSVWEVDIFRAPTPVVSEPGQPPFLPACVAVADARNGLVLEFEMLGADPSPGELQAAFLTVLERQVKLPGTFAASDDATYQLVGLVAAGLGIAVEMADTPVLDGFRTGLRTFRR